MDQLQKLCHQESPATELVQMQDLGGRRGLVRVGGIQSWQVTKTGTQEQRTQQPQKQSHRYLLSGCDRPGAELIAALHLGKDRRDPFPPTASESEKPLPYNIKSTVWCGRKEFPGRLEVEEGRKIIQIY